MNRKAILKILILISLCLLVTIAIDRAIQIYTATFNYTVKPIGTASWNGNPYDLGTLMAGETYAKVYENILKVTAYKTGKVTINFRLNVTEPSDFQNLEIVILDDSNVEVAKLTPSNPTTSYEINSPQTMKFTIKIVMTISSDVTEHAGTFHIDVWIT
ncbi:hypothetical protein DRJ17_06995 [Candidatus Woesearchaeota archaeon]|nr:MAG: hypothetical protein DRJ17_06995 [Candidatus Woesearchaeota archaeon]